MPDLPVLDVDEERAVFGAQGWCVKDSSGRGGGAGQAYDQSQQGQHGLLRTMCRSYDESLTVLGALDKILVSDRNKKRNF